MESVKKVTLFPTKNIIGGVYAVAMTIINLFHDPCLENKRGIISGCVNAILIALSTLHFYKDTCGTSMWKGYRGKAKGVKTEWQSGKEWTYRLISDAKGWTTRDVPITMRRSHFGKSCEKDQESHGLVNISRTIMMDLCIAIKTPDHGTTLPLIVLHSMQ